MASPTHRPDPLNPSGSTVNEPELSAGDSAGLSHVFDSAEKVTKVAGVLAVFGYIALRSHLNYLGVSAPVSLDFERYLMEIWSLVGATIPLLVLVLAAKFISVPATLLYRRLRPNTTVGGRRTDLVSRHASGWMFAAAAAGNVALFLLLWGRAVDVVVGRLDPEALQRSGWSILVFWILLALCAGSFWLFLTRSGARHPLGHSWFWAGLALFALILQLSIFYGRSVRSTEYPVVRIVPSDSTHPHACGLLLLQTDKDVRLWRASGGVGEVLVLPIDGIASIRTGGVMDVLTLADSSVKNTPSDWPRCPPLQAPRTHAIPLFPIKPP